MKNILIWSPRVLAISLMLFVGMFALDVFSEGYALVDLLLALFMHLLPSIILLLLTALSWKRPKLGAVFFMITAVVAGIFFHPSEMKMPINLWIASPLFLISVLFFVSHKSALKN